MRKGRGKEAKLCFSGHVLMENRHGLCVDLQVAAATGMDAAGMPSTSGDVATTDPATAGLLRWLAG